MTRLPDVDVPACELAVGLPLPEWAHDCHGVSLAIVKARLFPGARVARGWTPGVRSQHSWVALGDIYAPDCIVVDPTLWSYVDSVSGIWVGYAADRPHTPHGAGSIYAAAKPAPGPGPVIALTARAPLSREATEFLHDLGPLDARGWMQLANSPMLGWPSAEIVCAMADTPGLSAYIPLDIIGMLTDRNPHGLYLAKEDAACTE